MRHLPLEMLPITRRARRPIEASGLSLGIRSSPGSPYPAGAIQRRLRMIRPLHRVLNRSAWSSGVRSRRLNRDGTFKVQDGRLVAGIDLQAEFEGLPSGEPVSGCEQPATRLEGFERP
jgi:hypothetical protein